MLRNQILHVWNFELSVFLKQNVPTTADEMCLLADQLMETRNTSAKTLCAKVMKKSEVSKLSEKQIELEFFLVSEQKNRAFRPSRPWKNF